MMTIQVGKKNINLGWETAGSILVLAVTLTWGLSNFTNKITSNQDKANAFMAAYAKKDSLKDEHMKRLDDGLLAINIAIKGIRDTISPKPTPPPIKYRTKLYIQRHVNGRIQWIPTK